MKQPLSLLLAALLSLSSPLALSSENRSFTPNQVTSTSPERITVKHLSGEVSVNFAPKRAFLFDFGLYDTMQSLGLSDYVAGLPLLNLPSYLKATVPTSLVNAGAMKQPDLALISEIAPELVVITGRQGAAFHALSEQAPTLNLGTDKQHYLSSVKANIVLIGQLYGQEERANAQLQQLDNKIAQAKHKAAQSQQRALVLLHNEGKLMVNQQPVISEVIGLNLVVMPSETQGKGVSVSTEAIAQVNPDLVFIVDRSAAIGATPFKLAQFDDAHLQQTTAYQNSKIIILTPDLWYLSGGGLQSLSLQIDEVLAAL